MSHELKVVICGTQQSVTNIEFCVPVTTKILYNANEIEGFIAQHSPSVRFIIIFLDLFHQTIESTLTSLSNKNNVIATLICDNSTHNLMTNQGNLRRISKHLITYKTTLYAINAYESIAKELYASGRKGLAIVLERKANELRRWFIMNIKVMACHILIIPLNTTYENLIYFQLDFIELCKSLWPDKQIVVCTIYDYIALEESNPDDHDPSNDSSFLFQHQYRITVCDLIQQLAPIRIYLVGNETRITNYWSRLLIPKELDNGRPNASKYTDACTFMEYEPVSGEIRNDVPGYLGCVCEVFGVRVNTWQVTRTIPVRLGDINNDKDFKRALERVYDTLQQREDDTNVSLWQKSLNYCEKTSDYSEEFHLTAQAQHCQIDQDGGGDETMDISMQRDYQLPPTN